MADKKEIFMYIEGSGNLPSLPEILVQLIDACNNDETPISEIADIVEKDSNLSLQVLKLVNSSYYGLAAKFSSIAQAVVYLGVESIKNIAISTSVCQVFTNNSKPISTHFSLSEFWWESLLCGSLARAIAQKTELCNAEEAYLAGILHDIGKLLLVKTYPSEHETILRETKDTNNVIWAEKQLIGIDHAEAGGWLTRKWNLNQFIADAIELHHAPSETIAESLPLVKILHLAAGMASNDCNITKELAKFARELELDSDDLTKIANDTIDSCVETAATLSIPIKRKTVNSEPEPEAQPIHTEGQETAGAGSGASLVLTNRIRSFSLLSSFLESLFKAKDQDDLILVFREALLILLDIEKSIFFLPTGKKQILSARYSSPIAGQPSVSEALALPLINSQSSIVASFNEILPKNFALESPSSVSLADKQILMSLACERAYCFPITARNMALGVLLVGIPGMRKQLNDEEIGILTLLVQQIGISFYADSLKREQNEEIERIKLQTLETTAKRIAHEINTPLGIIGNYLTITRLKKQNDTEFEHTVQIMQNELGRISELVDQLNSLSGTKERTIAEVDINSLLADTIDLLKRTAEPNGKVSFSFRPDASLPIIYSTTDIIKQILLNLFKNAVEASPPGGRVDVMTRTLTKKWATNNKEVAYGIEIRIRDFGEGLPEFVQNNLYHPFLTTKSGKHSGLGLSIVKKLIEDLAGTISYRTMAGKGTMFVLSLPVRRKKSEKPTNEKNQNISSRR